MTRGYAAAITIDAGGGGVTMSGQDDPRHDLDGYDIFADTFRDAPHTFYASLRRSRTSIARSDRWGGSWMLSTYADIRAAIHDPTVFSSRATEVAGPPSAAGGLYLPPLTSDPADHGYDRRLLTTFLTAGLVAGMEPDIRLRARELLAQIIHAGGGDMVDDFARPLTLYVLGRLLGAAPGNHLGELILRVTRQGAQDQSVRAAAIARIRASVVGLLEAAPARRDSATLFTHLLAHPSAAGAGYERSAGLGTLIVLAAADTTWSAIGAMAWHLAGNPRDWQRLRAEPATARTAIEEFLRFYAPVTVGRRAMKDVDLQGRLVPAGQRVLLPLAAANRDPAHFADPEVVDLSRRGNRHMTFGGGAHRCPGALLVRTEMRIALQELLAAVTSIRLREQKPTTWSGGQVRGPLQVPVLVV